MPKRTSSPIVVPSKIRSIAEYPLFSPSDIKDLAEGANVAVTCADFSGAADFINQGISAFVFASQKSSAHGEFKRWNLDIAKHASALLYQFGDVSDSVHMNAARRSFFEYPTSFSKSGVEYFDLYKNFDDILFGIGALRAIAESSANIAKEKEKPGHQTAVARPWLGNAICAAWNAVTGKSTGGTTTPTEHEADRTPRGPFISFTGALLNLAADRLESTRYQPNKDAAPHLRSIASSPHSIAGLQRQKASRVNRRLPP